MADMNSEQSLDAKRDQSAFAKTKLVGSAGVFH
jgi:hypothetical protein